MRHPFSGGRACRAALPLAGLLLGAAPLFAEPHALLLQTDFGTRDGAVAAMRGVAFSVSPTLAVLDLSHENAPFDVWEGAYRLTQAAPFWPAGTVFVSVIDPGVGTDRAAIVLKTRSGHFFVGPDNGTFTLVAEQMGIAAVRTIDEVRHRRPGSARSYTFHGRDIFAYVGAKLAAGAIVFEEVGDERPPRVVLLPHAPPREEKGVLHGAVPYLDFRFGNVWTNIGEDLFLRLSPKPGEHFLVTLREGDRTAFQGVVPFARTFGDVAVGQPLLYVNSLLNLALALNEGDFAKAHGIGFGSRWTAQVERAGAPGVAGAAAAARPPEAGARAPAPVRSDAAAPRAPTSPLRTYALRLRPGQDLRQELLRFAREHDLRAATVLTAVGSLTRAVIRFADQKEGAALEGRLEIVSLVGTLSRDGGHLHMSVADGTGQSRGGHLLDGSTVYTTVAVVLGEMTALAFSREKDLVSGYDELVVRERR